MREGKLRELNDLFKALTDDGHRIVGPKRRGDDVVFAELASVDEYSPDYVCTANSAKDFVFARTEPILAFTYNAAGAEVEDLLADEYPPTVIFGARPCDARGMKSLDAVFSGEYDDDFYLKRRAATTIVAVSCTSADDACFCTSTGGRPDGVEGADILLTPLEDGSYYVETGSPKGKELLVRYEKIFAPAPERAQRDAVIEKAYKDLRHDLTEAPERIKLWLDNYDNYDSEKWPKMAARCLSCGACTFVCPTCHCFDIVDEGKLGAGERKKNWDACQFDHFTLHASGHNPRERQPLRWRNRFTCKFKIFWDRWNLPGCVGCGRCIRVCPVGQDITEVMAEVAELGE
jgi:ferredoxin